MTDNGGYPVFSADETRALAFAAIVGIFTATAPDDSSLPTKAYEFKAMAMHGLNVGHVDADRVRDMTLELLAWAKGC